MSKYIDDSGLTYLWSKIKGLLAGGTSKKAQSIPFGEVDDTSTANAFTATVEGITALEDGVCCYLKNTVVTSAAATVAPKCWTLNVNNLGAKPVHVTTAASTFSTTQFTVNYKFLFTYDSSLDDGDGGWYIGLLYNTNTTYSTITQAEIDAGTGTKARNITPKLLRDNFYTEDEVDGLIPTVPTKVSDLTNDAGYITGYTETDPTVPSWAKASTKPSYTASEVGALPDTTVIPAAQINSDWDATSGVAQILHKPTIPTVPTTLSSFTDDLGSSPTHTHSQYLTSETEPDFNGSAAATITSSDISNWNGKTSNVGTITGITMNGASKGTSGVVDLGTVITAHQSLANYVQKSNTSGLLKSDGTIDQNVYLTTETEPAYTLSAAATLTSSNIVKGTSQSYNIWSGTLTEYNAITTKNNSTLYFIKES